MNKFNGWTRAAVLIAAFTLLVASSARMLVPAADFSGFKGSTDAKLSNIECLLQEVRQEQREMNARLNSLELTVAKLLAEKGSQ